MRAARLAIAFLIDSVPFTKDVRDGLTSLGGSESACLGLARALARRGHQVHIYAAKLADEACGPDGQGVLWHAAEDFGQTNMFIEWDVVVGLRQPYFFGSRVQARLRVLWNQDLLVPQTALGVMAVGWNIDHLVYVSDYHRRQWEALQPELARLGGWVTKNGYDVACVPTETTKHPSRIIHISRPERGLAPLLAMWPELRRQRPDATLQVCRYASMYDGEGTSVRQMVEAFDAEVARVQEAVGGIEVLGTLAKPALYRAISEAAVMWYPGVSSFAETSCIAAVEAQACGTPFVGSYRGALPETIPSGVLLRGEHDAPAYQRESIAAVLALLDGCRQNRVTYRDLIDEGRRHVRAYTYDVLAEEWETQIHGWFEARYAQQRPAILRRLLHDDDHTAARLVAEDMGDAATVAHCDRIIRGEAWTATDYAETAIQDPEEEMRLSGRLQAVAPSFSDCTRVLDVACGNGSFALLLAQTSPTIRVHGIDYAQGNIDRARACAEKLGLADRVTFACRTVYDFHTHQLDPGWAEGLDGPFDGLFVGEFLEHVAGIEALVDGLETVLTPGARVVYTCPSGPFRDLSQRGHKHAEGHVHCFTYDDLQRVFGQKADVEANYYSLGITRRGAPIGHWVVRYHQQPDAPAGARDVASRLHRVRPMPTLTVGIIAGNAENDLGRCLASVWGVADEIIVGDTFSTDDTTTIAAKYGARVLFLDPLSEQPEGFAGARNAVLAEATGDWFLWIDTDEMLVKAHHLRAYLEGALFDGVVLHQNHVAIDALPSHDVPVRVFRRNGQIRFYGCVHEQPQSGGPNGDIHPILDPSDVQIIHTGYLTESQRESKRTERNRALMLRDMRAFPDRLLSQVIYLREAVIQSDAERAHVGLTERVQQGYHHAIRIFTERFADPAHKYHVIARPWYEGALRALGIGWEMELTMAGKRGGLKGSAPERRTVWVQDYAEYARLVAHQVDTLKDGMGAAPPSVTNPDMLRAPTVEAVPV